MTSSIDDHPLSRTERWVLSLGLFVACTLIAVVERLPERRMHRASVAARNPGAYKRVVCGFPDLNGRHLHSVPPYDEW